MIEQLITSASEDQSDYVLSDLLAVAEEAKAAGLIDAARADAMAASAAGGSLPAGGLPAELNRALAEGPAAERALDAITPLFEPDDVIELRALNPREGGAASFCGRPAVQGERQALLDFIRQNNGLRNLYFGANARRLGLTGTANAARASDVSARRAAFLDLDDKDAPASDPGWTRTIDALRELGPLLIVNSGNGHHVWLALEAQAGAAVGTSAKPLAAAMARIGSDNMSDPPRIARLPNTVNLPTYTKHSRGAVARLSVTATLSAAAAAPRSVDALCAALEGVAHRLGLPGTKPKTGAAAASVTGASGEEKTPWPAPSGELLRMAVDLLPNDAGHFDARNDWAGIGNAIKGAALAGTCEAEGHEAWLDFCGRWDWGGDPDQDQTFWDTCRNPHAGWGYIMRTLERVNPAGHAAVKLEVARHGFAQTAAQNVQALSARPLAPVGPVVPAQIKPRQWLYGRTVIAGFLSMLIAPGGAGKSALMMVEAVAMATGRELLSGERSIRPLRVLYHNAEDAQDEQRRRLAAVTIHHGVTHAEIGNRLFLTSGRELPLQLARMGKDGPEVVPGVVDWLVDTAYRRRLDVIVLDPLGAMHGLNENDNSAMNLLAGALREVADRTGAAVVLLHHTSKAAAMDMDAAGAGASRGASALVDAVRVNRQLVRMTPKDAGRLGIAESDRRDFMRAENGKANLARAEDARWLRLVSVPLGNGDATYPHGDEVVTVERWTPQTAVSGTPSELSRVQAAIEVAATPPRLDQRSPDWVGWLVAAALGLDAGGPQVKARDRTAAQAAAFARVQVVIEGWLADGALVRREERDPKSRRTFQCVGVGVPAILADPASAPAVEPA
jgi:hypothetical protein